eukprot:PRCOL_00005033-RA
MFLGRKASGAGASGDGAGEALSPASAAAFIGASPLAQGGAPSRSEEPRTPRRGGMQANIDVAAPSEALMNTLNALNANMWIQSACMAVVTTVLLAAALHWLQPVMVPLVLAILLSYALSPVIGFCRTRMYMPHLAAVVVSLLIALLVLTVVANILYQSVRDLSSNTDAYVKRVNAIAAAADSLTIKLPGQEGWERDQLPSLLDIIKAQTAKLPIGPLIAATVKKYLEDLAMGLTNTFLVFLFVIYLLERPRKTSIIKGTYAEQIEKRIKQYLLTKTVLSVVCAGACTFVLWAMNVDMALVFGLFTFILKFIPEAGTIIAVLMPVPLVLVNESTSLTRVLMVLVLPAAIHIFLGNFVEPKVLGDHLQLHPITVLAALIFWGMLWGVPGLLLAAPMTAALKILLEGSELTKPVAKLMAGDIDQFLSMRARGTASGDLDDADLESGAPAGKGD